MNKLLKYIKNPYAIFSRLGEEHLLNWVPDEPFLKLVYRGRTGQRLDLDYPLTFNEKLQWLKLHDQDPRYTTLVDKHLAKAVVAEAIGDEHIVPTLGVWADAKLIPFDDLPKQFVLKTNHDSGGVIVCRDGALLDRERTVRDLNRALSRSYYPAKREWPYRDVAPLVFAETFLPSPPEGIIDYKFYCFDGEPAFLYVSQGMDMRHEARLAFLDLEWQPTGFTRPDYLEFEAVPPKPEQFELMLSICRKLAKDIPFVRVDLFEVADTVYFSEMTFHPTSGMMLFAPPEADRNIGEMLKLPSTRRAN